MYTMTTPDGTTATVHSTLDDFIAQEIAPALDPAEFDVPALAQDLLNNGHIVWEDGAATDDGQTRTHLGRQGFRWSDAILLDSADDGVSPFWAFVDRHARTPAPERNRT